MPRTGLNLPDQFSIFRIYLGIYLLFVFLGAIGSSDAIWSSEGMIPSSSFNPTYGVFPNLLDNFDSPLHIKWFLITLSGLSILFILGLWRPVVSFLLWIGLASLLNRNNLIINPAILYIGWLLLASALIPPGEAWSVNPRKNWHLSGKLIAGAWLLFALGYFFSGIDKLHSVSWIDGSALPKIFNGPMARVFGAHFINTFPEWLQKIATWAVIGIELSCLPLALFSATRKLAWILAAALQFAILIFLNINPIALGMLAFHLFIWDNRAWHFSLFVTPWGYKALRTQ